MYASGGYTVARFSANCCPNLTIVVGELLVLAYSKRRLRSYGLWVLSGVSGLRSINT